MKIKKLFAVSFLMCSLFMSVAYPQNEEKAYCTVKAYSKTSGVVQCTNGTIFHPEKNVKRDRVLEKDDKLIVRYTERDNKKFWYSISVEVKIFK